MPILWGKIPDQRAGVQRGIKEPIGHAGGARSTPAGAEPGRRSPGRAAVGRKEERASILAHRWGGGARDTAQKCHAVQAVCGEVAK